MKVLVTGADGFLGNNIVRNLLKEGYTVIVYLQEGRNIQTVEDLDVHKVYGDILDLEKLIEASKDCDFLIHAAANTSIWPYRSEIIRAVNEDGTRNVIQAVQANKIKRLVAIGSATSFSNGTLENPGSEDSPFTAGKFGLDYIDSKWRAQQLILEAVKSEGLEAIILNPTFMLGPYDTKPSSGELLLALYHQKVPGYTTGGRNFIHVQDVAIAATNALIMGRPGECYIMANENLSYKDFNHLVADELGIKAPKLYVPKLIILLYGRVAELIARLAGKVPAVSSTVAKISLETNYYSSAKAIKELGLPQTPIRKAIREAYDWFKENGYLKKK